MKEKYVGQCLLQIVVSFKNWPFKLFLYSGLSSNLFCRLMNSLNRRFTTLVLTLGVPWSSYTASYWKKNITVYLLDLKSKYLLGDIWLPKKKKLKKLINMFRFTSSIVYDTIWFNSRNEIQLSLAYTCNIRSILNIHVCYAMFVFSFWTINLWLFYILHWSILGVIF